MNRLIEKYLDARGYTLKKLADLNNSEHAELLDIDTMARELNVIRESGEHLVILPDFDMDGIMSGTLGYAGLSELGFNVDLYRPNPSNGYGFDEDTIRDILVKYPDVDAIISCDTGITCYAGAEFATDKHIKVLITDHHKQELDDTKSLDALVVVNPNRLEDTYKNKGICGAHVFYQVLQYYADTYGTLSQRENIRRLRVFAGIGTISDVMPLVYENRDLVRDSCAILRLLWPVVLQDGCVQESPFLTYMNADERFVSAFKGLVCVLKLFIQNGKLRRQDDITEEFFGYYLAPMFNSVKRMNVVTDIPFGVFFSDNADECAKKLWDLNEERKAAVAAYYEEMMGMAQSYAPHIYYSNAPAGILGLLATKRIGETGEPTFVLASNGGNGFRGSGRSPLWFPAISLLQPAGFHAAGHEGAFGIGVTDLRELKALAAYVDKKADELRPEVSEDDVLSCDIEIATDDTGDSNIDIPLFLEFIYELKQFAPFGNGFEAPVIMFTFNPSDGEWTRMGSTKQHVKGTFSQGFELVAWNKGEDLGSWLTCSKIHAFGTLSINEFAGRKTVNFIASDIVCEGVGTVMPESDEDDMVEVGFDE